MNAVAYTRYELLRTIRERLSELMKHWRKYSMGLVRKASESGLHMIAVPISQAQETYIKSSIWRLRIIAAGLTIPLLRRYEQRPTRARTLDILKGFLNEATA